MIYKYNDAVSKGSKSYNMLADTMPVTFEKNFTPLFFNNYGNVFYGGFEDKSAQPNIEIALLLRMLINDILPPQRMYYKPEELLKRLKLIRFHDHTALNISDYSKLMNTTALIEVSNDFSIDAMNFYNSVQETKYNINQRFLSLVIASNNKVEMLLNLFKLLNKNTSSLPLEKLEFKPGFDNTSYNFNTRLWGNMIMSIAVDVLIMIIGLDKIETTASKTITTNKRDIYETFYNYMIMGFDVKTLPKIIYNPQDNDFHYIENNLGFNYISSTEKEYKEEIELIRQKVPINDRYKYLK